MAWIKDSGGIFRLNDSDAYCGSYISVDDAATILGVDKLALNHIPQKEFGKEFFISELDLHRAWGNGSIKGSFPAKIGNATRSLDELILIKLIKNTLDGCSVEPQVKFGRKRVDIKIVYDGKTYFVEFVGPTHFIQFYQRELISPLIRKREIEDYFGEECVIYPFWIQRCAKNIKAIVGQSDGGLASVWSTSGFFGDFMYPDSADIILQLSKRFGAVKQDGIGYMYGNSHTNKPIHPIIDRILTGQDKIDRLIPKGNHYPESFWLPKELGSKYL